MRPFAYRRAGDGLSLLAKALRALAEIVAAPSRGQTAQQREGARRG